MTYEAMQSSLHTPPSIDIQGLSTTAQKPEQPSEANTILMFPNCGSGLPELMPITQSDDLDISIESDNSLQSSNECDIIL